jgi:hypothetical protein
MADEGDFFNDPKYPDRPKHPDLWRLVDSVNYLDGEATEGGRGVEDIIGDFIDPDSLIYMAKQRVLRGQMQASIFGRIDFEALAVSLYLDAFALGYRTAQERKE